MAYKKLLYEIVDEVNAAPTIEKKLVVLRQHKGRTVFRDILRIAYDPRVEILIPETKPPYTPSTLPPGMAGSIDSEYRRFRIFIKGKGYDGLRSSKRESVFIDICSNLYVEETEKVFIPAFTKKLRLDGITAEHLNDLWGMNIPIVKQVVVNQSKPEAVVEPPVEAAVEPEAETEVAETKPAPKKKAGRPKKKVETDGNIEAEEV